MDIPISFRPDAITKSIIGRRVDVRDPYLAAYLQDRLRGPSERLCVLYAGRNRRWSHAEQFTQGHTSRVAVRIRLLIELGIRQNAAHFLIAHGHPSGSLAPSSQDLDATRRLLTVATALDLDLVDHLIVSKTGIFSIRNGRGL